MTAIHPVRRMRHEPIVNVDEQGKFEDGVGVFEGPDKLNGKPIITRYTWSKITATSARWEQAFSGDGGKTWETNWIMDYRRTRSAANAN